MFLWQWRRGHWRVVGVMYAQRPANASCNTQQCAMCNVQRIPGATVSHCYAWGWAAFGSILVIAALSFRFCHQHCVWMFPSRDCIFSIGCNANHKPFRLKISMNSNKCLYEYNCYSTHFICLPLLRDKTVSSNTSTHYQVL